MLSRVMWLTRERGLQIQNLDATIMLESPRLRPYIAAMREKIAEVLEVDLNCVSVKAKSGEGLDAVGTGLAVTVQAIVLITSCKRKTDED
jgi:2-C-methyl-D-erythritol 2,4-cyclodiphosphate synthase